MEFYRIKDIHFDYEYLLQREDNPYRKFIPFDRFSDLYSYFCNNQHLYEVIDLNKPHKLFFDIDIDHELNNEFFDKIAIAVIKKIINTFRFSYSIELDINNDILVFKSHGTNKGSFHIIVDNYFSSNLYETKQIVQSILNNIEYSEYIDDKIYTKYRNMRLYKSTKYSSDRVKVLYKDFKMCKYNKYFDNDYHTLYRSLISNISGCKEIIPFKQYEQNTIKRLVNISTDKHFKFDKESLESICKYLKSFEIREIRNNLIILNSKDKYKCKPCNRYHENENPYVIYKTESREVLFYCRRQPFPVLLNISIKRVQEERLEYNKLQKKKISKIPPKNIIEALRLKMSI